MPNRSATLKKSFPGAFAILCFMCATILAECAPVPCGGGGGSPQGENASLSVPWNQAAIIPSDLHDYLKRSDNIITASQVSPGPAQPGLNTALNQNQLIIPAMPTVLSKPLCNLFEVNTAPNPPKDNNIVGCVKLIESIEKQKLNESFKSINQDIVSNIVNPNVQSPLKTDLTGLPSNISIGQFNNGALGMAGGVYTWPAISYKDQALSIVTAANPTATRSALNSFLPMVQPIVQLTPQPIVATAEGKLVNDLGIGGRIDAKRENILVEYSTVSPVNSPGCNNFTVHTSNSNLIQGANKRVNEILSLYVSTYEVALTTTPDPIYDILDDNWLSDLYPSHNSSLQNYLNTKMKSVTLPQETVLLPESVPLKADSSLETADPVRCANLNINKTPSESSGLPTTSTNMTIKGGGDEMSLHLTFKGVQPRIPPNVYIVLPLKEKEVNASIEPYYFKVNFRNNSMSGVCSTNSTLVDMASPALIKDSNEVISTAHQMIGAELLTTKGFFFPVEHANCTTESLSSLMMLFDPTITTAHQPNYLEYLSSDRNTLLDPLTNRSQLRKSLVPHVSKVKRSALQLFDESLKAATEQKRMKHFIRPTAAGQMPKECLRGLRHHCNVKNNIKRQRISG